MRSRFVIVALAVLAAFAFAVSVQGGRWWSLETAQIGPFGSKHCFDGTCTPTDLAWLGDRYTRIGMATWAAGTIATLVLLVLAAGVAARRIPRLVAKLALVSLVTSTITGAAFVGLFPLEGASLDRGALLFVLALAVGAAAAILALRSSTSPGAGSAASPE